MESGEKFDVHGEIDKLFSSIADSRLRSKEISEERTREECMKSVLAGKTVVMLRNDFTDRGYVKDLYSKRRHIGYYEYDNDDGLCSVYKTPDDDPKGEPQIVNTDSRIPEHEAAALLLGLLDKPIDSDTPQ